nr:ankyrin repeat-containing protein ITN1-like [Tanacetum cinerariifolium]
MVAMKVMVAVMATVRMEELSDLKKTSNVKADQLQSGSRSAVVDVVVYGYDAITLSPHKVRALIDNEVYESGETTLFTSARTWYIDAVKVLLSYTTKEGICLKNKPGFNPLHITASEGILAAAIGAAGEVDYIAKLSNTMEQGSQRALIIQYRAGNTSWGVQDVINGRRSNDMLI